MEAPKVTNDKSDFPKLLPVRIRLKEDVNAQYDTKQRNQVPNEWQTIPTVLRKGSELILEGKAKYADLYYTNQIVNGYPVDVFYDKLFGKVEMLQSNMKSGNNKTAIMFNKPQTALTTIGVGIAFGFVAHFVGKAKPLWVAVSTVSGLAVGFIADSIIQKSMKK